MLRMSTEARKANYVIASVLCGRVRLRTLYSFFEYIIKKYIGIKMYNIDDKYGYPRDVLKNECLCQIIGQSEIVIENYKCITKISGSEIEVLCKKYKIHITGSNLNIEYYNNESMVLGGCIHEISFY